MINTRIHANYSSHQTCLKCKWELVVTQLFFSSASRCLRFVKQKGSWLIVLSIPLALPKDLCFYSDTACDKQDIISLNLLTWCNNATPAGLISYYCHIWMEYDKVQKLCQHFTPVFRKKYNDLLKAKCDEQLKCFAI